MIKSTFFYPNSMCFSPIYHAPIDLHGVKNIVVVAVEVLSHAEEVGDEGDVYLSAGEGQLDPGGAQNWPDSGSSVASSGLGWSFCSHRSTWRGSTR